MDEGEVPRRCFGSGDTRFPAKSKVGVRWMDGQKVCEKTGSMRGGHRGSRESSYYDSSASPVRGKNIQARSEDVDTFTEVGKVGMFITESRHQQ